MRFRSPILAVLFASLAACTIGVQAGEIEVKQNPVPASSFAVLKYKLEKGDQVQWIISPEPKELEELTTTDYAHAHFNGTAKSYVAYALVTNFDTKKQSKKRVEVTMGKGAQPPPGPDVDPDVKPIDPDNPPPVVTSFRVIFVQDPTATLTQAQFNTINATIIDKYLNTACTKVDDHPEWRRWSSRQKADDETPSLKALWDNVQPKLTVLPCVAIEVNGKVEIINLPTSPEEMVGIAKKYRGDK